MNLQQLITDPLHDSSNAAAVAKLAAVNSCHKPIENQNVLPVPAISSQPIKHKRFKSMPSPDLSACAVLSENTCLDGQLAKRATDPSH